MLRNNPFHSPSGDILLSVHFFTSLLLTILFLLSSISSIAQQDKPSRRGSRIIDDTTKQIYGPNTSHYYFEQDVFFNREVQYSIDTSIRNFHRYNYVQRYNNLYQDLGNIGTAIQPIYYQTPDVIGVRSGAQVYDLYWDSEAVRYFDTRSPYSNMKVVLGGKGRSMTRVTYSRNINPRWNFGFNYRALYIDRQIQRKGKGDRLTRSNYYDVFTAYQSKDSAYRLFSNLRRMFHRVNEFGGVKLDSPQHYKVTDFFLDNAQPWLTKAESNDLRINFHLFHQYSVGKGLQVYNIFDRYMQQNKFIDIQDAVTKKFYDFREINRDSTKDATRFKTVRTEIGIKGKLAKLFYNGYYAIRHYSITSPNLVTYDTIPHLTYNSLKVNNGIGTLGNESYLGGRVALQLDSLGEVNGWVELMNTNYRIQGEIRSKWFEGRIKLMQYTPGYMEQFYRGGHDVWNNDFSNIRVSQLNGYVHYRSSVFNLSPGLTFTRLHNYVYYKKVTDVDTVQQVLPVQSSGSQTIASPEVRMSITFFRHITFSSQVIYTKLIENADNAIRIPELFVNSQLSYSNIFYSGNMDMHAGVDFHWKSDYYAPGYDPAIRQFYVQDSFKIPAYPIVDLFFNVKIKRGRIFIKYHNILQAFTKSGYLPTPYYPGQANILDFGFDWSFYN